MLHIQELRDGHGESYSSLTEGDSLRMEEAEDAREDRIGWKLEGKKGKETK